MTETILVTGGAGFIGSAVIRRLMTHTPHRVVNLDCLTYAANPLALEGAEDNPRYTFEKVDILDAEAVAAVFARHRPTKVIHLAAESHVDRSIDGPGQFIQTNVVGTYTLLQAARSALGGLSDAEKQGFRFHHVSTDEVFGSLSPTDTPFTETTPYQPNSPYSASKAASDHLVRAWGETYGLPVVLSNCSNNYGPWQFPEKLIPVVIANALEGRPIPVYGDGSNVRDWLHVEDHAEAIVRVCLNGSVGESYNVGGNAELRNIDLVRMICVEMDRLVPKPAPHEQLITFVKDRPGHDLRYAIDASKIKATLGWTPRHTAQQGLAETIAWYLSHQEWLLRAKTSAGGRLGLA